MPIPKLTLRDSFKLDGYLRDCKFESYLVEGYRDTKDIQNRIDSFAERAKAGNPFKFFQYDMTFYKKSNKTNLTSIDRNPRIIDLYSQEHDLIYKLSWSKGRLVTKMKIKNGRPAEIL